MMASFLRRGELVGRIANEQIVCGSPQEADHPWRHCDGSFKCPRIMALSMVETSYAGFGEGLDGSAGADRNQRM